jgi:hypothetical protein
MEKGESMEKVETNAPGIIASMHGMRIDSTADVAGSGGKANAPKTRCFPAHAMKLPEERKTNGRLDSFA